MQSNIKLGYGSPRWTGEIADCSLPMTFDTYSNCSYGCVYCFSQYQRALGGGKEDYLHKVVEAVNQEKVKRIFLDPHKNQFWNYVKTKRPIQYGGLSDQFDEFERKYGITLELLKFFKSIDYPICFSSKSAWVFFDERYRALFHKQDNWNMKHSIITLDEAAARKIEVGVSSPQKRLEGMFEYSKLNKGGTTLRLRPFIIGVTDRTYIDLIKEAKAHGASAVTTEFFCLERRSVNVAREHYQTISDCCGFDIVDFYVRHSKGSGYLRLNRDIKRKYIEKMYDLCKKLDMRFYVSDAHFKELSSNGCCCGLPPEYDYSRGNFSAALQIAKRKGVVTWDDVSKDMQFLEFDWNSACGFNTNSSDARAKYTSMTMKDYLRYLWNSPNKGQSPYKMFGGVLKPIAYDANKNIVYEYNPKRSIEAICRECRCKNF